MVALSLMASATSGVNCVATRVLGPPVVVVVVVVVKVVVKVVMVTTKPVSAKHCGRCDTTLHATDSLPPLPPPYLHTYLYIYMYHFKRVYLPPSPAPVEDITGPICFLSSPATALDPVKYL